MTWQQVPPPVPPQQWPPYQQPIPPRQPGVITWFKVYAVVLCVVYALTAAMGFAFIHFAQDMELDEVDSVIMGPLLIVVGGVFFVACLLPLLVQPRPWVWVYDLVIICIGMTSACTLPASIPLLIFWIKPEVKQHFGFRPTQVPPVYPGYPRP